MYARIAGTGSYLPKKVLTNADLEALVDTSDEWIRTRTGIEQRHVAADGETTGEGTVTGGSAGEPGPGTGPPGEVDSTFSGKSAFEDAPGVGAVGAVGVGAGDGASRSGVGLGVTGVSPSVFLFEFGLGTAMGSDALLFSILSTH